MKQFRQYYFNEKRREHEKNIESTESAWDVLLENKDNEDVFVTFTRVPKVGINPKTKYNTPAGIYTYPVPTFIDTYIGSDFLQVQSRRYLYSVGEFAPFAGDSDYINFLRVADKRSFINDAQYYDENDYKRDLEKIYKRFPEWKSDEVDEEDIDHEITYAEDNAEIDHPFVYMWNLTRGFAEELPGKQSVLWNKILRDILGYSGIADRSGKGFIHPKERAQAVFLHREAIEAVTRLENKPDKLSEEKAKEIVNDLSVDPEEKAELIRDGYIQDEEFLKEYIRNHPYQKLDSPAMDALLSGIIKDQGFLKEVALDPDTYSDFLRKSAVEKMTDEDALEKVIRNEPEAFVRKSAHERQENIEDSREINKILSGEK